MTVILAALSLVCIGYIAYLHSRSHRDSFRTRAIEAIIETTRYGVIEADLNGIILIFNPAAEKMLGYQAEEIIGKVTPAIIHVQDEVIARAMELGIEPGFDVFVKNPREKKKLKPGNGLISARINQPLPHSYLLVLLEMPVIT